MSIEKAFIVPHPPLIIPDIGMGQEKKIQKTIEAYHTIAKKIGDFKPDTIIITTPHSIMYSDYIHISPGEEAAGDFGEFGEPEVGIKVRYDSEFTKQLSAICKSKKLAAGTSGERGKELDHGTMIPLYFVNQYYSDYKVVRISISGLPFKQHYEFGKCIQEAAEKTGKRIVFIASGDLSHRLKNEGPYGYREEGVIFDREITDAMEKGDFQKFLEFKNDICEAAAECGLRSFIIMAGALNGKEIKSRLLSYEGPYGVGYAVAEYEEIHEDPYVRLARHSLENYVLNHKKINKTGLLEQELLRKKAGVFVSLKLDGELRGCIGTIFPTTGCIGDEIIQNALSAGLEDSRFYPVKKEELPELVYSVDVLGTPEPIRSVKELDPKKYGVIVTRGNKRGLLLPNLDGINTAQEQVAIALQKAGISPNEKYDMERFEVVRHK